MPIRALLQTRQRAQNILCRLFFRESSSSPIQNLDDRPLQFRDSRLDNPSSSQIQIGNPGELEPRIIEQIPVEDIGPFAPMS